MNRPAARIRAILFDWAGTTIDHGSRAPVEVFIEVFRGIGIDVTTAEARGPMGKAKREHIAELLATPRVADAWRALHNRLPTEADVDRLYADFLPLQSEVLSRHCEVIAGVPEVVAECRRRGIRIGSSTGYTRALMDVVAPLARAGGYDPEVIICSDDVSRGRPAPWMNFLAAERLDVFPMSDVLVVDDTVPGIEAGRLAGSLTVAVTRTGNSLGLSHDEAKAADPVELAARIDSAAADFRRIGADYVIETVADLLPILDALEAAASGKV